jgi:polyisoprenyl-phosphate glycosyltransferase
MKVSIVIPVYNGAKSIEQLVNVIFEQLHNRIDLEIILVNDFSTDESWGKLVSLQKKYTNELIVVDLSNNFGEHNAVMAGYHYCQGDYIVNIDDDFQNPPSEILKLLDKIQEGHEVVYSVYSEKKHSFFRNIGSKLNDKVANIMLKKPHNLYLSSFRIISASLLQQIIRYEGPYPYIDGLILKATSKISQVGVTHNPRSNGNSNYTFVKLIRLWSHMFFNFSITPLRIATILGGIFSLFGFLGAIVFIVEKLFNPELQIGWASLMVSVFTLSGIQLFMMGIIGEYVGRIFLSQNKMPQFVVHQVLKGDAAKPL